MWTVSQEHHTRHSTTWLVDGQPATSQEVFDYENSDMVWTEVVRGADGKVCCLGPLPRGRCLVPLIIAWLRRKASGTPISRTAAKGALLRAVSKGCRLVPFLKSRGGAAGHWQRPLLRASC